MSVNLLAINVGNTRVQFAAFLDGAARPVHSLGHDEPTLLDEIERAAEPLGDREDAAVYIAATNDRFAERLARDVAERLGLAVTRIERDVNVPIGRQLDRESLVGEDRLLNAAAAFDQLQQACIVVDAGTAVTVDFVDGKGTFHGGAILPGATMMLRALHEHTAQLPDIALRRPEEPIGHNTAQAMLSGVVHGIRGAVRELCEKYAEHYGAYPKIIATGGDAELLFQDYELIEAIVPDLTLTGMSVTRRTQLEQSE